MAKGLPLFAHQFFNNRSSGVHHRVCLTIGLQQTPSRLLFGPEGRDGGHRVHRSSQWRRKSAHSWGIIPVTTWSLSPQFAMWMSFSMV